LNYFYNGYDDDRRRQPMNLKTVLRTYALLRQLTDDETALLNTLRGMSDGERELLVESLSPQKMVKKRKSTGGKSQRATSLAEQIKSATSNKPLEETGPKCIACGHVEDYEDHQQPSPHYHPFTLPAQSVGKRSSANGKDKSSTASSETVKDDAGDAALGASGGD
jgi:hypothetical protein